MEDIGRKALLFDVYGPLLTEKQRQVYDLAVGEDMSLGEIAEVSGVSRQAVHDMVRRTGRILEKYEEKLGLAGKFLEIETHLTRIRALIDAAPAAPLSRSILAEIDAIDRIERN
ncbi:MAG: YlxM family DNA-binding protein [Bacillota bacterium]